MKYIILLLSLVLASCTTSEYALNSVASQAQAAAAAASPASTESALAGLQPAPAGLSKAQARKYYAAQVAAAKAATTQKVKNSNNTTVEQKISNVSTGVLVAIGALSGMLGALLGFTIGRKI